MVETANDNSVTDNSFMGGQGGEFGGGYSAMDVRLSDFEGPLDLLLELAVRQKVDLREISIVELAEQYIAFIEDLRSLRISIAADYLLMASRLAYLKSRLLLPAEERSELDEDPQIQAQRLAWRLHYLSKLRELSEKMWHRPHCGRDFFGVGVGYVIAVSKDSVYEDSLHDLLSAYGGFSMREPERDLRIVATDLYSAEQLMLPLWERVEAADDWVELGDLLPEYGGDLLRLRSAVAATLVAGLELVRRGDAEVKQAENFAPVYVRKHVG